MEAAAKSVRAGVGSAGDRLSALPDELLRHVLSFLSAREVVQTTVLSRRWTDLWRSVPGLNINFWDLHTPSSVSEEEKMMSREEWNEAWAKMEDFTTNLLMLHNAPCLDAFRLTVFPNNDVRNRHVDRWLRRAIKYNPLLLEVNVLGCSVRCEYHLPRLGSSRRRLKRLHLFGVSLDHSFPEEIHSVCPDLEDLVLKECLIYFSGIQCDKLRNLVVDYCREQPGDVLVIRAPRLASLCLNIGCGNYRNEISLDAGNSLARASVSLMPFLLPPRLQAMLLGSLFNVTSLELYGFQAMAMLDKDLDKFVFENLKTLSLNWCFISEHDGDKFKALGKFLQKSPILEKLVLKNFWAESQLSLSTVKQVVGPVEFSRIENLRTLLLDECDLRGNFLLLRYCLQNSPNLEKLTVRLCKLAEVSTGGEGKAKSKSSQFQNLVHFQCQKLKSTEIIYREGGKIPELVRFLLGISGSESENTIKLTEACEPNLE